MEHDRGGVDPAEYARVLQALAESEQRNREIFDVNPAVKIVIDPDTGRIVDANEAACAFYGWPKPVLVSKHIQDINTASPERVRVEMDRAHAETRLFFNFQHRLASGDLRDVEVYTGPVTSGGKRLLHSIIIDVTERKRLQDQLLQAQRMDAMGRMAGGVAHDFNNLLTVILTCVELVRREIPAGHPASGPVDEIAHAARRGAEVTQQLLALARKRVVEPEVVELPALVERTSGLLRRVLGEQIELTTDSEPAPWRVEVDPGQFEQVLVNLAVNARDAMPNGGTLRIATRNIERPVSSTPSAIPPAGRWVELAVFDSGSGMPPDVIARIFEPFFTTKPPGRGTGLGLSTVFGIVRQAGGHLAVESEPGKGSVFRIFLPAIEARVVAPRAAPKRLAPVSGGERVLVVEDDAAIRRLLASVLGDAGYVVEIAGNGVDALALARSSPERIDLLLTDLVMPKLGGAELARLLLAERPSLAVLFMSGHPSDLAETPGSLGAAFLAKPFTPDELEHQVRAVLEAAKSR